MSRVRISLAMACGSDGRSLARFLALCLSLSGMPLATSVAQNTVDLDGLTADYQQVLEQIVADSGAPGGVAAFELPDGRMSRVAAGFADLEAKQPMLQESRFLSGSVGKTFVGALTLKLAREGVLDLDDPISKWLGETAWFPRLPGGSSITIRQLLMHRSGLLDHVHLPEFVDAFVNGPLDLATGASPEQLIAFVLDKKSLFPPGQGYSYTDTGFLLIGLIIEQATGGTYYAELQQNFLGPLGLKDTSPSNRRILPGLVPGYLPNDNLGQGLKTMKEPGVLFYNPVTEWTGGGLVTNPGDLVRWAKLLYEGKAMEGDYVSQLLCSIPTTQGNRYSAYGLGQGIAQSPYGIVYGHSGWIPGYLSFMGYYPEYRVAVAAQFNSTKESGTEKDPVALAKQRLLSPLLKALGD